MITITIIITNISPVLRVIKRLLKIGHFSSAPPMEMETAGDLTITLSRSYMLSTAGVYTHTAADDVVEKVGCRGFVITHCRSKIARRNHY
jgi:hypothetical protein